MLFAACANCLAQDTPAPAEHPKPTLYVTATSHLDTQWLWTIQTTIEQYIPNTLHDNFDLFEKHPHYVFSFEGAFRYMLAREYYPTDYERLKQYIAAGRWHVCGSSVDAGDVNVPSPESLIRHVLYGNGFFQQEFERTGVDIFLPDCFGFGYALPSIAAHCGLAGFSTQKLTWGSSVPIPFDVGVWEGVDGRSVVAALNPGAYVSRLDSDLSHNEEWLQRIDALGGKSGVFVGYKYFGTGDVGGAPDEESVQWLEKSLAGDGPVRVINTPADQLFKDLSPQQVAALPRYKGELLMTTHGTGCYTSQAAMKRWNRKNELLGDAVERAAVIAHWLGLADYPRERLREAWVRVLWHHFHDDLTGTSIPQAYTFSWNDEIIALNQFAHVLADSVGAVAREMDTRAQGNPLVVFNPLAFEREDVVEGTVRFQSAPSAVRVYDGEGNEVPSQVTRIDGDEVGLLFLAPVPSLGFAVFDVRPSADPFTGSTGLSVTDSSIENSRYRLRLDHNGDVAQVFDKSLDRELLNGPIRLDLFKDTPEYWSEWEVRYEDITADPYAHVGAPAEVRVVERGSVRATLEVLRRTAGSTFRQRISLSAGQAADRIEFDHRVEWRTPTTLLKAAFPLTASNDVATYDLGFGVIERPNNTEQKYEVPAQQWADLTDRAGQFGVAVLNDCKYGWDKPADDVLRLSLIHAPNDVEKELGWHRFTYALVGHAGDWRAANVVAQAARLNQPLIPFQTAAHDGPLGRSYSFLSTSTPQVAIRAVKKAENSDEYVVRAQETHGSAASAIPVTLASPFDIAALTNGVERFIRPIAAEGRTLVLDFEPFQPQTVALTLGTHARAARKPTATPLSLPFDADVVSHDGEWNDGDFDGKGHTLPAELLPDRIVVDEIPFTFGSKASGAPNALVCRGQKLQLPKGDFNRLYLLAATTGETVSGLFHVEQTPVAVSIRGFSGWIGQADSLVDGDRVLDGRNMAPAFIHRDEVAWVGTHRHDAAGARNEPYVFCYLFKYRIDLPEGAARVTLPDDERIRILAATAARNHNDDTRPAAPLYDEIDATYIRPRGGLFIGPVQVALTCDRADAAIVYTLDGSDPTADSARYAGPIRIAERTTLSARTLRRGRLNDYVSRATFTFGAPRPADQPHEVTPGLTYRYYEGQWDRLPDFDALTPTTTGTVSSFDMTPRARDDEFGFSFTGFVRVPRDGVYTFYVASDDGSRLYVGDTLVVDNDGLHGRREAYQQVAMAAGLHRLRVDCFERSGDQTLEVGYDGPGVEKRPIPADALYQAPSAQSRGVHPARSQ